MESLTESEINTVTGILEKLSPGFLPFDIFHQLARLTTLPIVEIVPLRQRNGTVEVLLLPRDADDPIFPNQLHTPGTVLRATDVLGGFEGAFARIFEDELNGLETTEPVFVKNILHASKRGAEASAIYWVDCPNEPLIGKFYSVDKLPVRLVESQRKFIAAAVEHFHAAQE